MCYDTLRGPNFTKFLKVCKMCENYITDDISQKTTSQLEVQGTEGKHKYQYYENHTKLGTLGGFGGIIDARGGHLIVSKIFSYHMMKQNYTITNLSQRADHTLTVTHHTISSDNISRKRSTMSQGPSNV